MLAIGGCASVNRAGNAYEELFAPLEGLQRAGREIRSAPLKDVARGAGAWNHFEFARRLDEGLGLPRDQTCAAHWYQLADNTPYAFEDWSNAWVRPMIYQRSGIPQARIALRRLSRAGVTSSDDAASRCVDARRQIATGS